MRLPLILLFLNTLPSLLGAAETSLAGEVRSILSDLCVHCHGPDAAERKGKLRLDTRAGVASVVDLDQPEQSKLLQRILHHDPDERMPPAEAPRQLAPAQIDLLKKWVEAGAPWADHWAFAAPNKPKPPAVRQTDWPRNEIDAFVLARLERDDIAPSPDADRSTFLRRLTLDLTGLPPRPDEVDAFLADESPYATERVVDRLLASPRYGEHMALAWLEAARYADTDGYQNDRIRYMWPYRDWVIQALNDNMPFDQFTIEQLAGDMLPHRDVRTQIASGFNRNHRINSEGGSLPEEFIVEYVVDRVETLGTIWLGLTLGCARCHDHKYDPVSQKEFYQLYAFFNNVAEAGLGPNNGNSPPFIPIPKSWPNLTEADRAFVVPDPVKIKTSQTSVMRPQPGSKDTVMVMHELDQPRPTYRLDRGLYDAPDKSERFYPDTPEVLGRMGERRKDRLGIAEWLLDPAHPLTGRVTVNRMWQHFFGRGLVRTSENFGTQGEAPSHPQLLDWLALTFVDDWDVKAMHRRIVLSSTYRQSSVGRPELRRVDPENERLARAPRLQLSGQALRDQALSASGLLVEQQGGPSVRPYMPPGIWKSISNNKYTQDKGDALYRRSLYTYWRRTIPPPTMMTFGAADRESCIVRKDRTGTALQALTMMNNKTFLEASRFLAERMMEEGGAKPVERMAYGFKLVLGREPDHREQGNLRRAYLEFQSALMENPKEAAQLLAVGEKPRGDLPVVQHAAYTLVANLIFNLDESLTRE